MAKLHPEIWKIMGRFLAIFSGCITFALAESAVADPRSFSQYSDLCYGLMTTMRPTMEYANRVPDVAIEDVMQHIEQRYSDQEIKQLAIEHASLIWMFGPISKGELEVEILSIYEGCMGQFNQCVADRMCIDE